jgi:hypothetical protein
MPKLSSIILDPYTNHESLSCVMNGAVQHPIGFHMVKPSSEIGGFHKQRGEVLRAVTELEGNGLRGAEREHAGIPYALEVDRLGHEEEDNTGILSELEGDVRCGEEQDNAGILSELEGDEVQCKEQDQADMPPEGRTPHPSTPSLKPFTGSARAGRLQGTRRVDWHETASLIG